MRHHALHKLVVQVVVEPQLVTLVVRQGILLLNQETQVMQVVKVIVDHQVIFKVVVAVAVQVLSAEMHLLHLEVMLEMVELE